MLAERNPWADAFTIIEMFKALGEPDPEWLHRDIHVPTMIIKGSLDGDVSRAFALKDCVVGSEIAVIEGAGHCCNMEQPWEWDDHAIRFLVARGLFPAGVEAPLLQPDGVA